jgi:integrase/recombinase XerD
MEPEFFLKPEEFHRLLQAVRNDRERLILLLLGGAGLRVGEMTQIKVEDLDLEAGYLYIRAGNAKGKKGRTVVLPQPFFTELHRSLADTTSGYVFTGRTTGHISTRQIENILCTIAELAGIQSTKYKDKAGGERHRITPHLLRHSFAVWSLDSGVPIHDLKEQLGHSTLVATTVYVQATPNHRRESYLRSGFSRLLNMPAK